MALRLFGINPDNREDESGNIEIPAGLEQEGVQFPNGIKDGFFNQLMFTASGFDHAIGSAAQLLLNKCTVKWDNTTEKFLDKNDAIITFGENDRVAIVGSDELTTNMNLGTNKLAHVKSINGAQLKLGDSGGGVPHKIIYAPVLASGEFDFCVIDILTDKRFDTLPRSLTFDEKRFFAYQGIGAVIKIDGYECYHGINAGELVSFDVDQVNPYLIPADGRAEHFKADASNAELAWFRAANFKLAGWVTGDGEVQGKFTEAGLASYKFHFGAVKRGLYQAGASDLDRHSRPSPTTAVNTTATFDGSSTVVFASMTGIRNGMRLTGGTVPDENSGTPATTYLLDVDTGTNSAVMIDADTDAEVLIAVAAGEPVSIDNSGAVGGSEQGDMSQGHIHPHVFVVGGSPSTTTITLVGAGTSNSPVITLGNRGVDPIITGISGNDGTNGTPRVGPQNTSANSNGKLFYKA